ncbi:MAG: DUF1643 domain-containing protein [Roseobacter sp.]
MLLRHHHTEDISSEAAYSTCESYRYWLKRRWKPGPEINFIMLNPSVADEQRNDPTVERCERRARILEFAAFSVTNIFAWRDTDPAAMRRAPQPQGPENDDVLLQHAGKAGKVIAAWGVHGAHRQRGLEVAQMLRAQNIKLFHLGVSKNGHPRHPLYVPYRQLPQVWLDPDD